MVAERKAQNSIIGKRPMDCCEKRFLLAELIVSFGMPFLPLANISLFLNAVNSVINGVYGPFYHITQREKTCSQKKRE